MSTEELLNDLNASDRARERTELKLQTALDRAERAEREVASLRATILAMVEKKEANEPRERLVATLAIEALNIANEGRMVTGQLERLRQLKRRLHDFNHRSEAVNTNEAPIVSEESEAT